MTSVNVFTVGTCLSGQSRFKPLDKSNNSQNLVKFAFLKSA